MFLHQSNNRNRGGSLVEIIIVIAIITGSLAAIFSLAAFSLVASQIGKQTTEAIILAEEAMEAIRNYRDGTDWTFDDLGDDYDGLGVVTTGILHHLHMSTDTPPRWRLDSSGSEPIGNFTRQIVFEDVCRDGSDNIVACPGGPVDTDSIEITVTVSWQERGRSHEVEFVTYLTNWSQ